MIVAMTVKTNDMVTRFKELADMAVRAREVITVSRPKNENVVLVSEAEFKEYARARQNAEYLEKLRRSDEDYKAGRVVIKTMDELKAMERSMK